MARSLLLMLLLQHSAAFSLLQQRTNAPLQQRTTNAPTALRASDDALDASSPDAFLAGLMNRVDELKARQLELPIVVLDATLPNQQLAISTSDQAFREMIEYCGVKAVEEAGDSADPLSALAALIAGLERPAPSSAELAGAVSVNGETVKQVEMGERSFETQRRYEIIGEATITLEVESE